MATYLLAWNPKRWTWEDLDEEIEQVSIVGYADSTWSTGNRKHLPVGSRFFLIRLGSEPKGIMASGVTVSEPYSDRTWDSEKTAEAEALYADIRFDFLSRDVLVTWKELIKPPFSAFNWGVQASGLTIPDKLAGALEQIWQIRTGGGGQVPAPDTPSASLLPEGAKRRIIVNSYERNPAARAECLAHHGTRCKVCDVGLAERFGPIAAGFIHVHHIVPLSNVGRAYKIDPVKDLVPVCPTCHAILHLRVPPLSVSEARDLLRVNSPSRR